MTSSLARALVLTCAGAWFLDHAAICQAQQTEADAKLVETIKAAAEKGDPGQQCALGETYFSGRHGVAQNYAEAVYWFRKAAEQGYPKAQSVLGACYDSGEGVAKDSAEAVRWYRRAAEQGYRLAQFNLGVCYCNGDGVATNHAESVKWYRRSAEQGYAAAQYNLGLCYHSGDGVAKDYTESVKWWRKAAEQGEADAQYNLGFCYARGEGVTKDAAGAVQWYRKAAEQGERGAQYSLGFCYKQGNGVAKDAAKAGQWYRKAAEQGHVEAQLKLGVCYEAGDGVAKDAAEAVRWYRKAAEQGDATAQYCVGFCYYIGNGVAKDYVQAYKWLNLSSGQGKQAASEARDVVEKYLMTREQIAEGQRLSREFKPRETPGSGVDVSKPDIAALRPEVSGTGFFISEDGYLVTNAHVVKDASQVRLVTQHGLIAARVVKLDAANDLAILKAEGNFPALPVASSRGVKLGATVATVGFPNIGLQGFAPKLAKGEIASLAGAQDDPRHFQISAPIQPGNSGGALVDERGNVIGVVVAKLSQQAALATSGQLAENVNYAVKSSFLLSFLESLPEVTANLKEPNSRERKFEDVVKEAQEAAALVLVY
jgi:TPR repeat protein